MAETFSCECGMYEHMGMLCCHAIRVMAHLGVQKIPDSHIMKRWTRGACRDLPDHLRMYRKESPAMKSTSFHHTALYRTAIEMVNLGDTNPESYEVAMAHMLDAMPLLSETSRTKDGLGLAERVHASESESRAERFNSSTSTCNLRENSLRPDMVAPPRRKDLGRPTTARARPGYEHVSVPRTRFCTICRSRGHRSSNCPNKENHEKKFRRDPHVHFQLWTHWTQE